MKIIFFGSSDFAVPALEALRQREEIALVVTQPDRKKGRSLKMSATSVKALASKAGMEVFQPDNVNSSSSMEYLKEFDAELFVVVSFGQILGRELLDIPKKFSLNVHASLLPKYRGAAPVSWAIANGDKKTGITIIKMNERMDEGEIVLKQELSIGSGEDAMALSKRLSEKGELLLMKSIELIKKGRLSFARQDGSKATYAPKLKKEDGLINWRWGAGKIYNRIRAFVPWPGCFTYWDKKLLKVWKAELSNVSSKDAEPGTVLGVDKNGILVVTGEGVLRIDELQLEGKRRMKTEEFVAGHKEMSSGAVFR